MEINKTAQGMPDYFPGTEAPAPAATSNAPAQPTQEAPAQQSTQSIPEVATMQTAIKNLYDTFKYYNMFQQKPDYREKDMGQGQYSKNYEQGSDTFLTFMLNRYVNKSPSVKTQSGQQKGQPNDLIKLIETLNQFSKNSAKPDGIWGPATNKALNNTAALAEAMLNMMQKFHIQQDNYTSKDLEELKQYIPSDKDVYNVHNKNEVAPEITKNIAKIKTLLGSFITGMTKESGKYINQQSPFDTNYGKKPPQFDQRNFDVSIPNIKLPADIAKPGEDVIPIKLGNLLDANNFNDFIKRNNIMIDGRPPSSLEDMNKIISLIETKLNAANKPAEAGY